MSERDCCCKEEGLQEEGLRRVVVAENEAVISTKSIVPVFSASRALCHFVCVAVAVTVSRERRQQRAGKITHC